MCFFLHRTCSAPSRSVNMALQLNFKLYPVIHSKRLRIPTKNTSSVYSGQENRTPYFFFKWKGNTSGKLIFFWSSQHPLQKALPKRAAKARKGCPLLMPQYRLSYLAHLAKMSFLPVKHRQSQACGASLSWEVPKHAAAVQKAQVPQVGLTKTINYNWKNIINFTKSCDLIICMGSI